MKYKLPDLPDPYLDVMRPGTEWYISEQMRQYAEQAVAPLLAEIERLKRGEFICDKCGLRKDAEVGAPDF